MYVIITFGYFYLHESTIIFIGIGIIAKRNVQIGVFVLWRYLETNAIKIKFGCVYLYTISLIRSTG